MTETSPDNGIIWELKDISESESKNVKNEIVGSLNFQQIVVDHLVCDLLGWKSSGMGYRQD